jgi:hypothetical protein
MTETLTRERHKEQKNKEDKYCHILGMGNIGLCGKHEKCNAPWSKGINVCRCGKIVCPDCLYIKGIREL